MCLRSTSLQKVEFLIHVVNLHPKVIQLDQLIAVNIDANEQLASKAAKNKVLDAKKQKAS